MDEHVEPRVFGNLYADVVPPGPRLHTCACFDQLPEDPPIRDVVSFHPEQQDTTAPGWHHLLELIDQAATDHREEFRPLSEMSPAECSQVITLPAEISRLTSVRHLQLYGSHLVRLPPEVAAMSSLERLTVYTSYRLHWFPYELTRCSTLVNSSVSTRALYGNYKFRAPFPELLPRPTPVGDLAVTELDPGQWGATSANHCSVCAGPIEDAVHQVWISLRIATDVLPLLVNACSDSCVQALPTPPNGYVSGPHGGGTLQQPKPRY